MDTKIYLNGSPSSQGDGQCVAAIVGKNPGSASAGVVSAGWGSLVEDNTLRYIGNRFRNAYQIVKRPIPELAYLQVWNLFYLCGKDLDLAIKSFNSLPKTPAPPFCTSETAAHVPPIIWFAWGGHDSRLNDFKARFLSRLPLPKHKFFYDNSKKIVVASVPTASCPARHPQGLPAASVEKHLSAIL